MAAQRPPLDVARRYRAAIHVVRTNPRLSSDRRLDLLAAVLEPTDERLHNIPPRRVAENAAVCGTVVL